MLSYASTRSSRASLKSSMSNRLISRSNGTMFGHPFFRSSRTTASRAPFQGGPSKRAISARKVRLPRRHGPGERSARAAVSDNWSGHRVADLHAPAAGDRRRDDPAPGAGRRHSHPDRHPYVSSHWHHGLPEERRHARKGGDDRQPRLDPH